MGIGRVSGTAWDTVVMMIVALLAVVTVYQVVTGRGGSYIPSPTDKFGGRGFMVLF